MRGPNATSLRLPRGVVVVVEWSPRLSRSRVRLSCLCVRSLVEAGGEVTRVRRPREGRGRNYFTTRVGGLGLGRVGAGGDEGGSGWVGLSGSGRQGVGAINIRVGALGAGRILCCLLRRRVSSLAPFF